MPSGGKLDSYLKKQSYCNPHRSASGTRTVRLSSPMSECLPCACCQCHFYTFRLAVLLFVVCLMLSDLGLPYLHACLRSLLAMCFEFLRHGFVLSCIHLLMHCSFVHSVPYHPFSCSSIRTTPCQNTSHFWRNSSMAVIQLSLLQLASYQISEPLWYIRAKLLITRPIRKLLWWWRKQPDWWTVVTRLVTSIITSYSQV